MPRISDKALSFARKLAPPKDKVAKTPEEMATEFRKKWARPMDALTSARRGLKDSPRTSAEKDPGDIELEKAGIYRGWKKDSKEAKAAASGGPSGPLGGYYDDNKKYVPLSKEGMEMFRKRPNPRHGKRLNA